MTDFNDNDVIKAFIPLGETLAEKDYPNEAAYVDDVREMFGEVASQFPGITDEQLCRCWDRCCDLAAAKDTRGS